MIAPAVLALANAAKYATALWDPIVIGLSYAPRVIDGRYVAARMQSGQRASRLPSVCILGAGLAIGKGKYIAGILYTTVARSSSQVGMGQSPLVGARQAWTWIGVVIVAAIGRHDASLRSPDTGAVGCS